MEVPDGLFKMPEHMQTLISRFSRPREVPREVPKDKVEAVVKVEPVKVKVNFNI